MYLKKANFKIYSKAVSETAWLSCGLNLKPYTEADTSKTYGLM